MKRIFAITGTFLFAAAVLAGCNKVETDYQYLRLDMANVSFLGDGNAPVTIKVSATGAWEVEPSVSWLKIGDKTDGSVTVTVDDNDTEAEREGKLVFTSGEVTEELPVNQLPMASGGYVYRSPVFLDMGLAMSPNGKYVVGEDNVLQDDETFNFDVYIYDLDTDEYRVVGSYPQSLFTLQKPMCITDQGLAFISDTQSRTVGIDLDGNVIYPEGVDEFQGSFNVQGSGDGGRILVGYQMDRPGGRYLPIISENGVARQLEIPELNAHDEPLVTGVMARGCSHDGKVIYGSSWDNMENSTCYWKADDGYKFHWAAASDRTKEQVETIDASDQLITVTQISGPKTSAELTCISPNGKWLAVTWQREYYTEGAFGYSQVRFPAFIDLENDKAYLFEDLPGGAKHVTDDGIGFTINGLMTNSGQVVDIENGVVLGNMYDWILDNYGIATGPGSIVYMTPDKQRFLSLWIADSAGGGKTAHWFVAPRPAK